MADSLPGRLSKLLLLLSSDNEGEIVAAAAAITRSLDGASLDWHDLAAVLLRGWSAPSPQPQEAQLQEWQSIARFCLFQGGGILSAAEADFLRNIAARHMEPSEKQWRWQDAIALALKVTVPA